MAGPQKRWTLEMLEFIDRLRNNGVSYKKISDLLFIKYNEQFSPNAIYLRYNCAKGKYKEHFGENPFFPVI